MNNTYSRVYDIVAGAETAPVVPFPQNEIDKPILSQYPRIGLVQLGNVAFPADDRDQAQRFFITPRRTIMDTALLQRSANQKVNRCRSCQIRDIQTQISLIGGLSYDKNKQRSAVTYKSYTSPRRTEKQRQI